MLVVFSFFAANVGSFAEADSCADATACRQRAARPNASVATSIGTSVDFDAELTTVSADGQALAGTSFSQSLDGTTAWVTDDALTKTTNGIHVESRRYELPCQIRDGECDQSATIAAAASAPC